MAVKRVRDEGRLEALLKLKAMKDKKESEGFEVEFKTGETFVDEEGEEQERQAGNTPSGR